MAAVGRAGECYVTMKLLKWEYSVIQCDSGHPFDLLVYKKDSSIKRIQVKSTSTETARNDGRTSAYMFCTTKGSTNKSLYTEEEVDVFAFFAADIERVVFYSTILQHKKRVKRQVFFQQNARDELEKILGF